MGLISLSLDSGFRNRIIEKAEEVLPTLRGLHDKEHNGGFFCIADSLGRTLILVGLGTIPDDRAAKYITLAAEKARRLGRYPTHQSSAQSRNPDEGLWGGAIRSGDFILSFSGLPEALDEAFMARVAVTLGRIHQGTAETIPTFWDNPMQDTCVAFIAG